MAKKSKKRGLFPIVLGMLMLLAGLIGAHGEQALIQYAVRAPQSVEADKEKSTLPNDELIKLVGDLDAVWGELEGSMSQKAVSASKFDVSIVPEKGENAQATLHAVDNGYFATYQKLLRYGRLIYPEEFLRGDKVIVLDEDLAVKLFMLSDPTGLNVQIGETAYRVIGVIRHTRSVGEAEPFGAYVPLNAVRDEKIDMDMLTVTIRPVRNSGALSAFSLATEKWRSGGSVYDLNKEAMRSSLLARFALCATGMYLMAAAMRRCVRAALIAILRLKEDLRIEYARVLMPGFLRALLPGVLGFLAALAGMACCIALAIEPVYTFPEWVPAVLVEWNDIIATFWNLTAESAMPIRCMTPEFIRIEFWARIARWGLGVLLFGCVIFALNRKGNVQRSEK